MALDRLTVNVPTTFDPSNPKMVSALLSKIAEAKGVGWEISNFEPTTRKLTVTRQSAITEISNLNGERSFDVALGSDVKANEGEKIAQRLEDLHPGYYLSEFRPFLGTARLTRMTGEELRCREAVAYALGVPRWEVQVAQASDGGFELKLPSKYSPSSHDDRLTEVAETAVGQPGWYVKVNAQTLTGRITPAEQPTFDPAYLFNFKALPPADKVSEKDLFKIPIGVALGGNGEPNRPFEMDLSDSAGDLKVGLAGSGKSISTQAMVFSVLAKGYLVALINSPDKATDFAWAKPYVAEGMWGCDSRAQAVAVAKRVGEEGERRGELLSKYGVSKWQDLPVHEKKKNPPMLLVADELAALLTAPKLPPGLNKEMRELPEFVQMTQDILEAGLLVTALSKIPAVYRAAGIRVEYLTQQPNERYGFSTTLKGNLPHRIMLGTSPSSAEKGHAFRTPEKVPDVPKNIAEDSVRGRGVGLAHLDGKEPVIFKGYFAPLDDYIAEAARRGFPRAISPAPSQSEINRLVPSIGLESDEPEGYGNGPRTYEAWELGPDGQPLAGGARANAAKAEATRVAKLVGGQ